MKKKIKILMILTGVFLNQLLPAQNLVPNWSFEDTVSCPIGTTQINKAVGWSSYRQTPDYFNSCNTGQVSTPTNLFGFQYPRTGNAYAGFATKSGATNYREIIGIELLQSLVNGQSYFISFYVSRSYNITINNNGGTNKIGARLSTIAYNQNQPIAVNNMAHIYTDSVLSDSINWTQISGHFIADSAYNFLSIGNFFTDSVTTFIKYDSTASTAYYYIDDIFLAPDSGNLVADESGENFVKIITNPGTPSIYIQREDIEELMLLDCTGRIKFRQFLPRETIEVKNFNPGVYVLIIRIKNKSYSHKLIIL